jgi:hypothetical protein
MTDPGNPLGIREIEGVVYIPLEHLSEEEVERLREEHVPQNTVGADLGASAPGIKDDADEQSRKVFEEALEQPISDDDKASKGDGPISPADALG